MIIEETSEIVEVEEIEQEQGTKTIKRERRLKNKEAIPVEGEVEAESKSASTKVKTLQNNQGKVEKLNKDVGVINGYIGTYITTKDGKSIFRPEANEIRIVSVKRNIENHEIMYELTFKALGKKVKVELHRNEMTKGKIQKLASYGADIFDHNTNTIIKHLRNEEQLAPVINVHRELGWGKVDGKEIFKYAKAIGIDSIYVGDLAIEQRGSLEGWMVMVIKEAIGKTPLEAAIVFGISALVVGFIGEDISLECILIHICGNSTQGKTSACQLSISTAGYPDTKRKGLMNTWNGTTNAIMGVLRGNRGLPVLFDEASVSNLKDFSNTIYTLATGREKSRMDKESQLQEVGTWNTTILSNGEHSLTVKSNQNIGVKMRVAEYSNITWTRDAANAEAIKEGVLQNYGHVAPRVAEKLKELGKEKVIQMWRGQTECCLEDLDPEDSFAPRIAKKLGVIMTAALILEETLQLGLNIEAIKEFIISNERGNEKRDLYQNAYQYLIEQVEIHRNNFDVEYKGVRDSYEPAKYDLWGKIEHHKPKRLGKGEKLKRMDIVIMPSKFNEIMMNGGFADPKIILSKWKEEGRLDCERDRLTRSRKIDKSRPSLDVYVIKIEEKVGDENSEKVKGGKSSEKKSLIPEKNHIYDFDCSDILED